VAWIEIANHSLKFIKSAESSRLARVCTVDDEVGNPVGQGVGFAGPGTDNHQKRATQGAIPIRKLHALPHGAAQ
jgi:hypothetical protein